jgi:O-antigen/teichoic acid export membrane protein
LVSTSVNRVARGGVAAFFIYGTGITLTYCSQLVLARILGVDAYGLYAYVFACIVVLAYFSTLGFDVGLLRFIPVYEAAEAKRLLEGVILYAQRRAAMIGVILAAVGVFVVSICESSSEVRNTFLLGLPLVPILALVRIRCAVVRAHGGVASALAPDRVVRDGTLIGLVLIAGFGLGWAVHPPLVMLTMLMSSVFALGCASLAMRQRRPHFRQRALPEYDAATWRRSALPLVILGGTEALLNRTGVILLDWMVDPKTAGIYSLAFNVALVVTVPRIAVNTQFAPEIAGLYARQEKGMMQALVTRAATWTLCMGFGIALVLFVLAGPLLSWFGPGYEAGITALRILLISQAMTAGLGSLQYVMTMTGNERSAATLLVVSAIGNTLVSVLLIGLFGLSGAATATAMALIGWNAATAWFVWRRLDLLPGVLGALRPFCLLLAPSLERRVSAVLGRFSDRSKRAPAAR